MSDRTYISQDLNFLDYQVSYRMFSNGDITKCFRNNSNSKLGIFLADTIGHNKSCGDCFSKYLDELINSGWGLDSSPEEELIKLSNDLSQKELSPKIKNLNPSGLYSILDKDKISLVNAGLPYPILFELNGKSYFIKSYGSFLDSYDVSHSKTYERELLSGDMILFRTDGIDDNIDDKFFKIDKTKPISKKNINLRLSLIGETFKKSRHNYSSVIADNFLDILGQYIIPTSEYDDDISFIVIKKL